MSRFGGLSEERPSVFKTGSNLGTHLSTQCSEDERQSRPCADLFIRHGTRRFFLRSHSFERNTHDSPVGHGNGEISHILRIYCRHFSYRPRQKTKDKVVTAQGAPCFHLGRVELHIQIRDFQKTWEFHILNNIQNQCILGIDFMRESNLNLDFDKKSLVITVDQIKPLPIVEKSVEIDLFDTKLDYIGVRIDAVLNQNHRPIAFAPRTLSRAEINYTVTERECLAMIWALNKFMTYFKTLPVKVITDHTVFAKLTNGKNLFSRIIRWARSCNRSLTLKGNIDLWCPERCRFSRNSVDNVDGSQISCAALRASALNSREQLIREQREDHELGHMYRYLENQDDGSVNATVCEGW
ncbi:hypothetical protein TNCV_4024871 [Trichonephila clavipes]|uniref:Reverse transcriptase RNase H-like domain-containing protein n=1 Tax=Trichonephila clavipes TaxID=2585209 RepID=A0A8X6WDF2_TRICX|nr:hypothetical protein TNCV_4024871 [Trichonephila clavipes]